MNDRLSGYNRFSFQERKAYITNQNSINRLTEVQSKRNDNNSNNKELNNKDRIDNMNDLNNIARLNQFKNNLK